MDILPKKSCSLNLSVLTIQQIKTLAKIYNCDDEWIIECLINEFYKDEAKRQETAKEIGER
jgi:hypothetical protein